jgi:hypothetical protein
MFFGIVYSGFTKPKSLGSYFYQDKPLTFPWHCKQAIFNSTGKRCLQNDWWVQRNNQSNNGTASRILGGIYKN